MALKAKYEIGASVTLKAKGKLGVGAQQSTGRIISRTEYEAGEPEYELRYTTSDGSEAEGSWPESELERAERT